MIRKGKGCLVAFLIVILMPAVLGIGIYLTAPKLMQRDIETPELSRAQINQAETKLQLAPYVKEDTLTLNVTELNALLQKGIQEQPALRKGKVTLIEDKLKIDAGVVLPNSPADFPLMLRSFAGKEVSVHLEVSPNMVNNEVYLEISNASIGVIPLPINTLISLLPTELKSSVTYTENGIKLNNLFGPNLDITDIKITNKDIQITYKRD